MNIGTLKLKGRTILAPLAGITSLPFRKLVKSCGCAMVCSEMISARGLYYNQAKTLKMLASDPSERPLSIQLFGADALSMAHAAKRIETMGIADVIDINFGCSVKKVVKTGAGVSLMKDLENAGRILDHVRQSISVPMTIKLRSGWDVSGTQALELAHLAQEIGVDALALHPRTATQGFRGTADWSLIKRLKLQCRIPVIGNGDIKTPEDAAAMIDQTGCDGVMIGRAALADPFILSRAESLIQTGTYRQPAIEEIFDTMIELTRNYTMHFGEKAGCRMLRGRLAWFVKGLPGATRFRARLSAIESEKQALDMIDSFRLQV